MELISARYNNFTLLTSTISFLYSVPQEEPRDKWNDADNIRAEFELTSITSDLKSLYKNRKGVLMRRDYDLSARNLCLNLTFSRLHLHTRLDYAFILWFKKLTEICRNFQVELSVWEVIIKKN